MFIPAGYNAMIRTKKPDWLEDDRVKEIWSVSACINGIRLHGEKLDWINQWMHNGYWHYNNIVDCHEVLKKCGYNGPFEVVYYEIHDMVYDKVNNKWYQETIEKSFHTNIIMPDKSEFIGHDIVTCYGDNAPGCSPLSCNGLSKDVDVNEFCLCKWDIERIQNFMENYQGDIGEPGPYRIYKVYKIAQLDDAPEPPFGRPCDL